MAQQVAPEHVLAVLGLQDRAADRTLAARRLLVPAVAIAGHMAALDLDSTQTQAGPRDEQVDLLLPLTLEQTDRVEQHHLIRQLLAQRLPDRPLGAALLGEVGLGREATRHTSF